MKNKINQDITTCGKTRWDKTMQRGTETRNQKVQFGLDVFIYIYIYIYISSELFHRGVSFRDRLYVSDIGNIVYILVVFLGII